MSQNGLTHFKNLAANTARLLKCVWSFWYIMHYRYNDSFQVPILELNIQFCQAQYKTVFTFLFSQKNVEKSQLHPTLFNYYIFLQQSIHLFLNERHESFVKFFTKTQFLYQSFIHNVFTPFIVFRTHRSEFIFSILFNIQKIVPSLLVYFDVVQLLTITLTFL